MKSKEIKCREDFERIFNVRIAEKCCASCKHSDIEVEGDATCKHPKRNDKGQLSKEDAVSTYKTFNVMQSSVCDLWEKGEN